MITFEQKEDVEDVNVEFNFHRQSSKVQDLTQWLQYPIEKVQDIIESVFDKVIKIPIGEVGK